MRNLKAWAAVCLVCIICSGLAGCASRHAEGTYDQGTAKPMRAPSPVVLSLCTTGLPTIGMWKCDPVFTDVNKDGLPDLAAIPRQGNGPHVWLGNGKGDWTDTSSGLNPGVRSCGGGLSFSDLNGDGHIDLAAADHCQGVFVYLGDGAGRWEMVTAGLYPHGLITHDTNREDILGAEDIDIGDANGDGFADLLVAATFAGGINLYLGDGTGSNWTWTRSDLPSTGWANRVMFTEVNGDGLRDIVAACSVGPRVWLGDGQGGWTPASIGLPEPIIHGLYRGIAVGDINEDGRPDLATANWVDGAEVYLQAEDGSWAKTPDVFPDMLGGAVGLALADIDVDGHLDLLVSGRLGTDVGFVYGVFLLLGDGSAQWTHVHESGLPKTGLAFTWGLATSDVNGDGTLDVAAGSGGIVATAPGPKEPTIATRLPVWCTRLSATHGHPSAESTTTLEAHVN